MEGGCIFRFLNIFIAKFLRDNRKNFEKEEGRERGNIIPILSLGPPVLQPNKLLAFAGASPEGARLCDVRHARHLLAIS